MTRIIRPIFYNSIIIEFSRWDIELMKLWAVHSGGKSRPGGEGAHSFALGSLASWPKKAYICTFVQDNF